MSDPRPNLLEFPCDFPVKVFGTGGGDFPKLVLELVRRHAPETPADAVSKRPSKSGKYTAVTVMLRAESQAQLDAIYRELTGSPEVLMAL